MSESVQQLLHDLSAAGFPVEEFRFLPLDGPGRRAITEILLRHLEGTTDPELIAEVCLLPVQRVPALRPRFLRRLVELLELQPSVVAARVRWFVAQAATSCMRRTDVELCHHLLRLPHTGHERINYLWALGAMKPAAAEAATVLREYLDDPLSEGHAIYALAKLGRPEDIDILRSYVDHRQPFVRAAVKKALERLSGPSVTTRSRVT